MKPAKMKTMTSKESPGEMLLKVRDINISVPTEGGEITIVRGSSLDINAGEVVCLVGESGSGKSVLARTLMGLTQRRDSMRVTGSIQFGDLELVEASESKFRSLRGTEMSMIFQEPMSSLDPVYTVGTQLQEAMRRTQRTSSKEEHKQAIRALKNVGIQDAERVLRSYPFELSGGMCQRVGIAMGLIGAPSLLIADEPTTALDATIQAQILDLMDDERRERNMAMLMVTHDFGVAATVADRIAVMYAGRIVETGTPEELLDDPQHPYTQGLLSCVPPLDGPRLKKLPTIPGSVPNPSELPSGCAFSPRCPRATEECQDIDPPLEVVQGRPVACWHPTVEEVTAP